MKRVLVFVAALAALLSISLTVQAHTEAQLEEWQEDWIERFETFIETRGLISFSLMVERHDWLDRHPCSSILGTYSEAECRPAQTHTRTARSGNPPSSGGSGMGTNVEQWRPLVESYFGGYTDQALRVMRCESGGNPNSYNPSGASGLFQMMPIWHRTYGGDPFNPADNVRMAWSLFRDTGYSWSHWVCRP